MPALSPTMSQGNLLKWHVKVGQEIAPGDLLADVETDKATLEWENQDEGFVAKLLVPEGGSPVQVGAPVVVLVEDAASVAALKDWQPAAPGAVTATAPAASPAHEVNSRVGPAARLLLHAAGLAPEDVEASGPHGIVTKGDALAAVADGVKHKVAVAAPKAAAPPAAAPKTAAAPKMAAAPKAAVAPKPAAAPASTTPAAPAAAAPGVGGLGYIDVPTTQIRRIIAQRLTESKTGIPHFYLAADVDLGPITGLREALKAGGSKVSVNDCIVRAVALALADVPAANALWDAAAECAVPAPGVDVCVAVATEGGLLTPIVKGADAKSLQQVSAEVRELARRARANKLAPEEFQGGSFTISNLGMYGIDSFSAIINPPQACIMAVGAGRHVAAPGAGGAPELHTLMTVTLSADQRVYDSEVASAFLVAFSRAMANPYRLYQS